MPSQNFEWRQSKDILLLVQQEMAKTEMKQLEQIDAWQNPLLISLADFHHLKTVIKAPKKPLVFQNSCHYYHQVVGYEIRALQTYSCENSFQLDTPQCKEILVTVSWCAMKGSFSNICNSFSKILDSILHKDKHQIYLSQKGLHKSVINLSFWWLV